MNKNKIGSLLAYILSTIPEINLRKLIKLIYLIDKQSKLLSSFDKPEVVCILNEQEYENLIYAMYHRYDTPLIYNHTLKKSYLN